MPQESVAASLIDACLRALPELGANFPDRPEGMANEDDVALVLRLIRALSHSSCCLVFVFDNLHACGNPDRLQCLQALLDYCPPQLKCLFAHRAPLPLSLSRLRDCGALLQIGPESLAWSLDEIRTFIRGKFGMHAYARAQPWFDLTRGWCIGLMHLSKAYESSRNGETNMRQEVPDALLDYLEVEVLQRLCEEDIYYLAALAQLEPAHDNLLPLIVDADWSTIARKLSRLSQCTGLLHERGPSTVSSSWDLHPILRMALQRRFSAWSGDAKAMFHRRASSAFESIMDFRSVVHHAICAGAPDTLGLMEQSVEALGRDGNLPRIAQVLALLPIQMLQARPRLQSWLAMAALMTHRLDDCRRMLSQAAGRRRDVETIERCRWQVIEGMLAIYSDDIDAAAALVPTLEAMPLDRIDAITQGGRRNVLSWIYIHQSAYGRARQMQSDTPAGEANRTEETIFGRQVGRCMTGFSLALEGKMNEAERVYREVLEKCGPQEKLFTDAICQASGLLGETLYELNDLDNVLALSVRLDEMERVAIPDTFLRVMLGIGRTLAIRGRLRESGEILLRLEQYARARNLRRILAYSLLEQCALSLRNHDRAEAGRRRRELANLRRREKSGPLAGGADITAVFHRADILCSIDTEDMAAARKSILRLMECCVAAGRYRRVAALRCQMATIERRQGKRTSAMEHMKEALAIGYRMGLLRSLLDAHPDVPDAARDILKAGGLDPMTAFQADLLCNATGVSPLAGPSVHAPKHTVVPGRDDQNQDRESLTEREFDIARQLILAQPNKLIARSLNLSPETVKWHLSNIYQKLGVASRHDAVARLRRLLPGP
ncbi:LuxR C-terminal-related transcriptional regulator [Candidimonas humi]|nr:LuxR C-terminal-related transcriptional regulator [Candidimonas humi]MBV6304803.1 LuxR C-terminal-related transcriptional regulator [Candidimonas humi]